MSKGKQYKHGENVVIEGCFAVRETDAALLVNIEGLEVWFPKSQIHDDSEVWKTDTDGALVITKWIAQQKGLI